MCFEIGIVDKIIKGHVIQRVHEGGGRSVLLRLAVFRVTGVLANAARSLACGLILGRTSV